MNQQHLNFVLNQLGLDSPTGLPTRILGGRGGHLMWRVNTENSSYAIKQLAPVIDLQNERMINKYELSETIASRFQQQGIPAVSAIAKSGKHLFVIANTGYLVYPWIDALPLGQDEITATNALPIAEILAKVHSLNMNVPELEAPRFDIYSSAKITEAIDRVVEVEPSFAKTLKKHIDLILSVNESYLAVIPTLKENTVVTHGDLDQNNVLWDKANQHILIDWESAKRMNPTREIVRTSLSWSKLSLPLCTQMITTYIKSGGLFNANHIDPALYSIYGSMIFWMLYNIDIVCNTNTPAERTIAVAEIHRVMQNIIEMNDSVIASASLALHSL